MKAKTKTKEKAAKPGFPQPDLSKEAQGIVRSENLLPAGLLARLHSSYTTYSGLMKTPLNMFSGQEHYAGLAGFRKVVGILENNGITIGFIKERELFIEVYRFMATRHILNSINWDHFTDDSLFQLVFPQPGMIDGATTKAYLNAPDAAARKKLVESYMERTNPHDGKQKLNMPRFRNENGETEFLPGSQHKYPQCQLIFDQTTQNCFAFCTYCFRHAQVRGDSDMFIQRDIAQVHRYLRGHKEVTDILITGGDAGFLPPERLESYIDPIIEDPELSHIRTIRLGTRILTYHPEMILTRKFEKMLTVFRKLRDNGIQLAWMNHFSTPREILNPATIAAVRRLQANGATLRSQSPVMNHISLFMDKRGNVDVDRTAKNWIDLGNILAMLSIGFHSMYCARPTGEHHYFTAPLAGLDQVFRKIYRSLASINRPSRHLSMTSSAGKISILGTTVVNGEKAFALAFTEGRNMQWLDRVFLAKYDPKQHTVALLKPLDTQKYFFEDELAEIEKALENAQKLNANGLIP